MQASGVLDGNKARVGAPYQCVDLLGLDVVQAVHRVLDLPLARPRVHYEDLQPAQRLSWLNVAQVQGLPDLSPIGQVTKSGAAVRKGCRTHQGVVVLNLLHRRLRGQRKLDDLETVKLLRRRRTARQQMHI